MKKRVLPSLCFSLFCVGIARGQTPVQGNLPPSLPPVVKPESTAVVPAAKSDPAKPVGTKPNGAKSGAAAPAARGKAVEKGGPYEVLGEYSRYGDSARPNRPEGYIQWLKEHRFKNGELDGLPRYAVILHASDVVSYLSALGYGSDHYQTLDIGSSDPNLLYVVKRKYGASFIVNRGLPGAGGITTQVAELGALGVKYVIHVGTCGVLGPNIREQSLILARGSYKDGGAVLLSRPKDGKTEQVAYPDAGLASGLEALLREGQQDYVRSTGFTIPVFYFQPAGLVQSLFDVKRFGAGARPGYVEMEEAPFFMAAEHMEMKAASLLIGTDRYVVTGGKLEHTFHTYDPTEGRLRAVRMAMKMFDGLESSRQ